MLLFDRYQNTNVSTECLPNKIDLGRYCMEDEHKLVDITNSNYSLSVEQFINHDLLSETNYSVQRLFQKMRDKENHDWQSVSPILQKSEINLTEFEILLRDNLFHLEEIVHQPHYLLDRTIEKVPTSRAKRIPSKSYQYLASHTEDWNARSIVQFRPSKVLHEELDINFNVYENQLFAAFIQRVLVYLAGRIKETADLQEFLKAYNLLLQNRDDSNVWWKKVERNLSLIGSEYEDDYTQKDKTDILSTTAGTLKQMRARLSKLQQSVLYQCVDLRSSASIQLRNTNVLVGHKHYKFLGDLWRELGFVRVEQSEEEKIIYEQETLQGLRSYVRAAIVYTCKTLEYILEGNAYNWSAIHSSYPPISFKEEKGIIFLTISNRTFRFVTIANDPYVNENLLISNDLYLLAYNSNSSSSRVIPITPMDADTIERIGSFIKSEIIRQSIKIMREEYAIPSKVYNFISLIHAEYIEVSQQRRYSFISFPTHFVNYEDTRRRLTNNQLFLSKSHPEKLAIEKELKNFIDEFNSKITLVKERLYCPNCHTHYRKYDMDKLNYIKCPSCNFILDSANIEKILLINKEERFESIMDKDWGMDKIEIIL